MNKPKLTNPKTKLATLQVVYLVFSPNLRHTMSDTVHRCNTHSVLSKNLCMLRSRLYRNQFATPHSALQVPE